MGKIQELPKSSSRLLTSSQIITSVYCIVKELLENSLDGDSKNIEIKLEDFGVERIEVKDNGSGIEKTDLQYVAKPHFTSKIASYSDLEKVGTYGFRGEALGAIAAVADLIITTKTSEEAFGYSVNFNHDGDVVSSKVCPCVQGTTVTVQNLFKNIPVRRQYYRLEKNKKEELHKIEELLIAYGCIQNDVRFALYHNKNLIWQKPALSNTKNALIHTLGNSIVDHLKFSEFFDEQNQITIKMYLPALEAPQACSLSSLSRCITSVNKRPVRIKAVDKLVKEYYNAAIKNTCKARYPVCYISFSVPLSEVDVNVEPNKTKVMLHKSEEVIKQFSEMLKSFYNASGIDNNKTLNNQDASNNKNTGSTETHNLSLDQTTNAPDFLSSLKDKCNAKLEESKLSFNTESPVSVIKESSKKNPTNILGCSQVDKSNFSMNKKGIVELNGVKESRKKKLKTTFQVSKNDINEHIHSLKNFFTGNKSNKEMDMTATPVSSVTVERFQPEKIQSVIQGKDLNNDSSSNITTTFAVSSKTCSENNLHSADNSAGNRKRHFSDSSVANMKLDEVMSKKPAFDVNTPEDEAWSRGIHSVGGVFQPVKILQPKPTLESEQMSAKCQQDNATKTDNSNKEISESKKLSFERKLTAFDVFCRYERLEVAAQNPEYSNQQLARVLTEKWNCLTTEEKAVYKNLLDKDYKKEVKKKERLGKIVSENLNKSENVQLTHKTHKKKKKLKVKSKDVSFKLQQLTEFSQSTDVERFTSESLNVINFLAPGIWICSKARKLLLLNTFRLQETVIYHRLLQTFHFDIEALDIPQNINASNVSEEGLKVLMELFEKDNKSSSSTINDERLLANGFSIKLIKEMHEEATFELVGITSKIAFYGIPDLKQLLLLLRCKGSVTKLSESRPEKVMLYLQSEANRISRQNPAYQRAQDIEDILNHNDDLLKNCQECIHHKPFFTELWPIS